MVGDFDEYLKQKIGDIREVVKLRSVNLGCGYLPAWKIDQRKVEIGRWAL